MCTAAMKQAHSKDNDNNAQNILKMYTAAMKQARHSKDNDNNAKNILKMCTAAMKQAHSKEGCPPVRGRQCSME